MSFLMTRVSKSDNDNRGKMKRILRFVQFTLKEKRSFEATKLDEIFTWVDASYAVHYDMKRNTAGVMSMVLGVTHCSSSKKKLNKKGLHNQR